MNDWIRKLFVEHSELFLKLLNYRWSRTEELVNGIVKVLNDLGVTSGNLLDLCCGNGRISIYMAKKGFKAVGVDISRAFVEDARRKAEEHGVSKSVTFLEGDVRKLKEVVGSNIQPFDVVVNAWTSIGYYSQEEDLNIFKQARELSREGAVLFIAETTHSEYLSVKFAPTSYMEVENIVVLESRKYDPTKSRITTSWAFYNKRGEDLKFIDKVEFKLHVYSLAELCSLLSKAGWKTSATYGSLATLQPRSPLSHLNIVARAQ
ncbi:MAG: methyltransferase domain-containing protein [Candidatus Bathyarchaeota archaeon]|nr:methyltransferase domain-containing protein [Candidatus Bathyarchaeota archaeon]